MAYQQQTSSFMHNIGQKVNKGLEIAATAKSIWDTGRLVYSGISAVAPYMAALL
jgi:hypothetical protein